MFEDFTERKDFHQVILLGVIILMDQSKKDPTKSNLMYLTIFMMLIICYIVYFIGMIWATIRDWKDAKLVSKH